MNRGLFFPVIVLAAANLPAATCSYAPLTTIATGARTAAVIALDLNKDRILDIVATNQADGTLSVALGEKGGKFKAPAVYPTSTVGPYETAAADFNGDGFPDLVSANFGAARGEPYGLTVSVHLNKGDGSFANFVDYASTDATQDKARAVTTGDFNRDGKIDIAVASQQSSLQVLLGRGDGSFGRNTLYSAGTSVHGVVAADFNKDGKLDLAFANNSPNGNMTVVMGKGDGSFEPLAQYATGSGTFAIDAGDFNGDGYTDLVTANMRGANISVFINQGREQPGKFAEAVNYPATMSSVAVTVADLNGDRKPDILSSANAGGVTDIYINDGKGNFAASVPLPTGNGSYDTAVADFDGDGTADIASALTERQVVILKGQCNHIR